MLVLGAAMIAVMEVKVSGLVTDELFSLGDGRVALVSVEDRVGSGTIREIGLTGKVFLPRKRVGHADDPVGFAANGTPVTRAEALQRLKRVVGEGIAARFQQIFETGTWKRTPTLLHEGHHVVAALQRPRGTGFLSVITDGSLRDSLKTLSVIAPGESSGAEGDCLAAALGPKGLFLTAWENGDVRRQTVKQLQ